MFEPSEESREKVWSVGEMCRAPYSNDGEYYRAKIEKIAHKNGSVIATISFDGYSSDDTEDIDVNFLQKTSRKKNSPDVSIIEPSTSHNDSLFKPLDGKEQVSWLSDKYADTDDEEDNYYVPKKKAKGVVAIGGAPKNRGDLLRKQRVKAKDISKKSDEKSPQKCHTTRGRLEPESESLGSLNSPQNESSLTRVSRRRKLNADPQTSDEEEEEIQDTRGCEGFEEEELEKPRFKFTPAAAKIPFQLSAGTQDTQPVQVPATINQYLRDYQRDGIKFLYNHYKEDRGAILGDDMGLGKTVQVIGLLSALLNKKGNKIDVQKQKPRFIRQMSDAVSSSDPGVPQHGPFLIIGPGSVLYNWLDELESWGYFTVGKYHAADKVQCLSDVRRGKYEVVVTTYETFRDNRAELNDIKWDAVFVDEVHRIKGLTAQITKSLRTLRCMRRFGLTGTAVQNSMIELWSILDWAQPGCLGVLSDFKEDYVDPIEKGQKKTATKRELAFARKKNQEFAERRNKMLLRRTKDLISQQLPNKDDNIVFCKLTEFQTSVYRAVLAHPGMRFVLDMDKPCDCGSDVIKGRCHNKTPDGVSIRQMRFTFMHILLKIANHVALLVRSDRSDQQLTEFSIKVIKYIQEKFPEFFSETREAAFRTLSDPKYCGKMKILKGLLSIFSRDHSKVLLFSYSTKVLDILEQYMMTTGYEYRRLDGSTSAKKRMDLVREFNNDPSIFIFLISTKAGGLGLNLTGANRVVIFDPNWNPTHDLQAQDRAYRIGQRRNVQVYRLISAGSIEENMYLRQVYKQQLDSVAVGNMNAKRYFDAISGDSEQKGELFGVKNMFKLHSGDRCLTMDILQRNSNLERGLAGYDLAKYIPPVESQKENGDDSAEDLSIVSDEDSDNDMIEDKSPGDSERGTSDSEEMENREKNSKRKRTSNTKVKTKELKRHQDNPSGQFDSVDGDRGQLPSSSFSSVGAVFEKCGVVHVHQNKKIIGASKAEDHMTRCAIQDVYEFHQNSQVPAAYCAPFSDSEDEAPPPKNKGKGKKGSNSSNSAKPRVEVIGNSKVLIGQTPRGIRQRQFQQMAGKESIVDFAETVLLADTTTRNKMLEEFYVKTNPDLSKIFQESQQQQQQEECSHDSTGRKKSSKPTRKMKDNPTLGVSYLSDSESLGTKTLSRTSSRDSEPPESLEIGRKVKKRKGNVAMTTRTRRPAKRSSGGSSRGKIHGLAMSPMWSVQDLGSDEEIQETGQEGPHSTELLDEIGVDTKKDNVTVQEDECTHDVSVYEDLDDIFLCDRKSSKSARKPPPGRGREKETSESKGRDRNVTPGTTADSSVVVSESSNIELHNNSTLKDDSFDCFSDPLKWKKKKKTVPQTGVDKLISDGDADFLSLFEKGKMKKKDRVVPVVQIKDDSKSLAEQTPSLF